MEVKAELDSERYAEDLIEVFNTFKESGMRLNLLKFTL